MSTSYLKWCFHIVDSDGREAGVSYKSSTTGALVERRGVYDSWDNSECDGPYAVPVGKKGLVWIMFASGPLYVLMSVTRKVYEANEAGYIYSAKVIAWKGNATLSYSIGMETYYEYNTLLTEE
jgi:hypothetical protein